MQNQQDLVYSYLVTTSFYNHLRIRLSGYLSPTEVKQLIRQIYQINRYKVEKIVCSFDQPTILILVYGEVKYNDKIYKKGQHVCIASNQTQQNKQMIYTKCSTVMMLNSEILDLRIKKIVSIRAKIQILEKCMPVKQLKLESLQMRKIAKLLQQRQIKQNYTKLPQIPGVFLFYQGIFQLCNDKIPVLQMENNFIEITDKLEFNIRLKSLHGKYGIINREKLNQILTPPACIQMQKLWKIKQQIKNITNIKQTYIRQALKLRQKISKKVKQIKKISQEQRQEKKILQNESLAASRNTMIQKCSTFTNLPSPRKSSLGSSRKTYRSQTSKSSIILTNPNKLIQNQAFSQNLGLNQQKLQKMRNFQRRKKRTLLQKQWYHLDPERSFNSLNQTYWKINRTQNPREAKALCNYKRVYRIYSDPCFKKPVDFRSL